MARRALVLTGIAVLAMVLLPAAPAAAGGCGEVTEGATVTVALEGLCFHPSIVRVQPGRTVTFVNDDTMDHSVIGAGFSFAAAGFLEPGRGFSHTFDTPGVYPFSCYLHPGMTGAVVVGTASGAGAATGSEVGSVVGSASETSPDARDIRAATASTSSGGGVPWWLVGAIGLVLGALATTLAGGRATRARS
jgi:plastocyanin